MTEVIRMCKGDSENLPTQPWAIEFTASRVDGLCVGSELIDTFWNDVIMLAESRGLKLHGGVKLKMGQKFGH